MTTTKGAALQVDVQAGTQTIALPPHMARNYIGDMLDQLSGIARQAGLTELDTVLALARRATVSDD